MTIVSLLDSAKEIYVLLFNTFPKGSNHYWISEDKLILNQDSIQNTGNSSQQEVLFHCKEFVKLKNKLFSSSRLSQTLGMKNLFPINSIYEIKKKKSIEKTNQVYLISLYARKNIFFQESSQFQFIYINGILRQIHFPDIETENWH